jgi:hypothetical protein
LAREDLPTSEPMGAVYFAASDPLAGVRVIPRTKPRATPIQGAGILIIAAAIRAPRWLILGDLSGRQVTPSRDVRVTGTRESIASPRRNVS